MITQRAKHINAIHHWCLDRVGRKELEFKYCSTHLNKADGLTKALRRPVFLASLDMWSMAPFHSLSVMDRHFPRLEYGTLPLCLVFIDPWKVFHAKGGTKVSPLLFL